jgi:xanthine dehydrogenase accessory factor
MHAVFTKIFIHDQFEYICITQQNFRLMKNIYLQIPIDFQGISGLALATVTATEGSTPQKPGSSALFSRSGLIAGTIGGGVLEGKVQKIAQESLLSKTPGHYIFMLDNSVSNGEDALCGGKISVLIDPDLSRHISVFKAMRESWTARIPRILVTCVAENSRNDICIDRYWTTASEKDSLPPDLKQLLISESRCPESGSGLNEFREMKLPDKENESSRLIFFESVKPQPQLIIAGAGHIGKVLSQIGSMLDFEVTVIDDRPEFASVENLPFANHIVNDNIGDAISRIEKGNDTYIVIVTRGHRDDGDALRGCIGSGASYIGMIGSKTKISLMHREFIEKGWATEEQWESIFAPIGLDIGSETVEEIAVSIAAQLVQVKNNK